MLNYFADIFCRQNDLKPQRAMRLFLFYELPVFGCYLNKAQHSVDVPANLLYNDSPSRVQRSSYSPGTSKDGHNFIDAVVRKPKSARYFFSINNTIFVTLELCFCRSDSDNVICSKTVTPNCANVFDVIRSEEAFRIYNFRHVIFKTRHYGIIEEISKCVPFPLLSQVSSTLLCSLSVNDRISSLPPGLYGEFRDLGCSEV
mmetsp:Transcript_82210/g.160457  ORF Transcript_82210/g.160457 Transcript_82210/m.160457 type:complete len:201 (-) Transcript_82210:291-893(-)